MEASGRADKLAEAANIAVEITKREMDVRSWVSNYEAQQRREKTPAALAEALPAPTSQTNY